MKNTEFITSKISPETKKKLQTLAEEKVWTLSHLVNKILEEYNEDKNKSKKD